MKKQTQPAGEHQKGFLALAGEALHVLGEEIVEGKDKVVETASEKFTQLKKAVGKIAHKKKAPAKRAVKKAVKKRPAKKAVTRKAKKVVRKATRTKNA
jgi:hypothetical protein